MAVSISQFLKHYSAQNIADYLASSIGSIPHCHTISLENIPLMTSVQNIPHCLTTNLEYILHCIVTSLENRPLCLAMICCEHSPVHYLILRNEAVW